MPDAASNPIAANLSAVRSKIATLSPIACLIAVSKTQPAASVAAAAAAGQIHFGENYVQEGAAKITELAQSLPQLVWHMIGPIQSNKTRLVAENFAWVHSVDRLKIAQRLSEQRPDALPALNLLLQINIDGEPSKSGFTPAEALDQAAQIAALPRITLRGLMCIPEKQGTDAFERMQQLFNALKAQGLSLDTLSMGMSADYAAAIAHGATHVRVGTAIFGVRAPQSTSERP
jgi:PLP dependent protein